MCSAEHALLTVVQHMRNIYMDVSFCLATMFFTLNRLSVSSLVWVLSHECVWLLLVVHMLRLACLPVYRKKYTLHHMLLQPTWSQSTSPRTKR